jgi:hypothetical protein
VQRQGNDTKIIGVNIRGRESVYDKETAETIESREFHRFLILYAKMKSYIECIRSCNFLYTVFARASEDKLVFLECGNFITRRSASSGLTLTLFYSFRCFMDPL